MWTDRVGVSHHKNGYWRYDVIPGGLVADGGWRDFREENFPAVWDGIDAALEVSVP